MIGQYLSNTNEKATLSICKIFWNKTSPVFAAGRPVGQRERNEPYRNPTRTPRQPAGSAPSRAITNRRPRSALPSRLGCPNSHPTTSPVPVQDARRREQARRPQAESPPNPTQRTRGTSPTQAKPTDRTAGHPTIPTARSERAGPGLPRRAEPSRAGVPVGPTGRPGNQTLSTPPRRGLALPPSPPLKTATTTTAPRLVGENHHQVQQRPQPQPQQHHRERARFGGRFSRLRACGCSTEARRRRRSSSSKQSRRRRWIGTTGWRSRGRRRPLSAPTRSASRRRAGHATTSPTRSPCSRFDLDTRAPTLCCCLLLCFQRRSAYPIHLGF